MVSKTILIAHSQTIVITTVTLTRNDRLLPKIREKKSMIEVLMSDMTIPYRASSGRIVCSLRSS